MPSLNVTLTTELLQIVQSKIDSGLYANSSEVIRDAIRQMDTTVDLLDELKLTRLKAALAEGIRQAEAGETTSLTLDELLISLNQRK